MVQRLAFICVLCLFACTASAAPCLDANCPPTALQIATQQLETAYQQLKTHWHDHDLRRKRLINSQRAWRSFRDAECEYAASDEQAATHIDNYKGCIQAMTEARTRALEYYLRCGEAETPCAVALPGTQQ
jgi:uncharacterized protein YecT (DUF1311 family)